MLLRRYMGAGNPLDDRWYGGGSSVPMTADAQALSPNGALKVSTIFRAINVLAAAVAVLPINVFRRTDTGREPAKGDPVRDLLRWKPNAMQTSYRWRHHLVGTQLLCGNYYAHKFGFDTGKPQLRPLDASRMKVDAVLPDGSLQYRYVQRDGVPTYLHQDDVLHTRGFSLDGITGVDVLELMRSHVSLASMNREARHAFMKNGMRPSVAITFPVGKEVGEAAEQNLLQGYMRAFGGPSRTGRPIVLGDGADIKPFTLDSRQSQYVESEMMLVEDFLRFVGVPGVLVGYADKTSTYASAEAFMQSFITHSVWPITNSLEQELTVSLYGAQDEYYVKFNLNALMRPDSTARALFYDKLVSLGIFTRNEVRELEERNPLPGLDEPLTPSNMGGATPGGGPGSPAPAPAGGQADRGPAPSPRRPGGAPEDDAAAALARAEEIVAATAEWVVRREVVAIIGAGTNIGLAARYARDAAGWRAQLADYYGRHVELVAKALRLSLAVAERYCTQQREALEAGGAGVVATWEAERVPHLVELALGRPPSRLSSTVVVNIAAAEPLVIPAPQVTAAVQAPAVIFRADVHPAPVFVEKAPTPKGPQEMAIVSMPAPHPTETTPEYDGKIGRVRRTVTRPTR